MTYALVKGTLDDNGRRLLDKLDEWKEQRGDIDFEDTEMGFNINLRTSKGSITLLVFWGLLNQKESFVMETRQHGYPAFARIERLEKIQVANKLKEAYFQDTKTRQHMNVRLEFRLVPMTPHRIDVIMKAVDGATQILRNKLEASGLRATN